jgi:hypothetical protein
LAEARVASDDRQDGQPATWEEINAFALQLEREWPKDITGVFMPTPTRDWWVGNRCEAPVLPGELGVRLHTGEIVLVTKHCRDDSAFL